MAAGLFLCIEWKYPFLSSRDRVLILLPADVQIISSQRTDRKNIRYRIAAIEQVNTLGVQWEYKHYPKNANNAYAEDIERRRYRRFPHSAKTSHQCFRDSIQYICPACDQQFRDSCLNDLRILIKQRQQCLRDQCTDRGSNSDRSSAQSAAVQ